MIPIHVKMIIRGDEVEFDLTGSHATIGSMYNCAFGGTFAAIVAGMKTFFPDIPLNSGLYRANQGDGAGGHHRQRALAGGGFRLRHAVRKDHEFDF
jgi:N-methylhydantoinase B/oxoprolinase/acetone carboxylase alpha subunit